MNKIISRFLLPLVIIISALFIGCLTADLCSNDILAEYTNPGKTFKIVKFDRGCGATAGNSIQLSVIQVNDALNNEGGNVFVANSASGSDLKSDITVSVRWLDDSTIVVNYNAELKLFKKETKQGRFKIIYRLK